MKQEETLAEFLLARIAEDEAKLRGLDGTDWSGWHADRCYYEGGYEGTHACDCGAVDRRLAECEAKRRVVERCATTLASEGGRGYYWADWAWHGTMQDEALETLKLLALPYADHQHCRQEWKP